METVDGSFLRLIGTPDSRLSPHKQLYSHVTTRCTLNTQYRVPMTVPLSTRTHETCALRPTATHNTHTVQPYGCSHYAPQMRLAHPEGGYASWRLRPTRAEWRVGRCGRHSEGLVGLARLCGGAWRGGGGECVRGRPTAGVDGQTAPRLIEGQHNEQAGGARAYDGPVHPLRAEGGEGLRHEQEDEAEDVLHERDRGGRQPFGDGVRRLNGHLVVQRRRRVAPAMIERHVRVELRDVAERRRADRERRRRGGRGQ